MPSQKKNKIKRSKRNSFVSFIACIANIIYCCQAFVNMICVHEYVSVCVCVFVSVIAFIKSIVQVKSSLDRIRKLCLTILVVFLYDVLRFQMLWLHDFIILKINLSCSNVDVLLLCCWLVGVTSIVNGAKQYECCDLLRTAGDAKSHF